MFRAAALAALLAACLLGAAAGQTTGSISGTVTGPSGAPIPGAVVRLSTSGPGGARTTLTDASGGYRFATLAPGSYRVRASMTGFRTAEHVVEVTSGAEGSADLVLKLTAAEEVLVTDRPSPVDTSTTETGTSYSSDVISGLPLDRNFADVLRANPGVVPDTAPGRGRSLSLSIYGATSAEHQWYIDGVNTTGVNRGAQVKVVNEDFIQEVEVRTGGYQAEYGRALGGVINVVTKSGGNQFHGGAFAFYDSAALQAEREFRTGVDSSLSDMRVADHTRTDWGADLGGYVVRDRLWFFLAYERIDFDAELSRWESSPTVPATMRFPLNGVDSLYSGKLTWNPGASTTLIGTVFSDPTTNSGAGSADPRQGGLAVQPITSPDPATWSADRSIGATDWGLRANQVLGAAALVTLQGSRHQERYDLTPTGTGVQVVDFKCAPPYPCTPPEAPNSTSGGFGFVFGPEQNSQSHADQVRLDGAVYLGAHELKAGGDYQDARTHAVGFYTGGQLVTEHNESGTLYYEHQFFASDTGSLTPIVLDSAGRSREYAVYLQDSWRAAPGLTVNAGVRLDNQELIDAIGVPRIHTNTWQPRLGVVWDPFRDGATKVYASAGRFSYRMPTNIMIRSFGSWVYLDHYNFDPLALFQDPNAPKRRDPVVFSLAVPVDAGLNGVAQDELTLGVERAFGPEWTVGLKGTYRRLAEAIEDRGDLDPTIPEANQSNFAITNPGSDGSWSRGGFPSCNGLDGYYYACGSPAPALPPARRVYRGIEFSARRTLSSGSWVQASYVFSSLRGNYEGETSRGPEGAVNPGTSAEFDYPALTHDGYGRPFLDRPHQLRLDGFVTLPFGLVVALQTWWRSGAPFNRYGYFDSYYGPAVHLVPRGDAGRLAGEWDANLSVGYPIAIGPVTVMPQVQIFNVFDTQTPLQVDEAWTYSPPPDYPASLYDPNQPSGNDNYGKVLARSDPRLVRFAIRVTF